MITRWTVQGGIIVELGPTAPAVTYEDVASTMPHEIVDMIAITSPCVESANREHLWDHEFVGMWRCAYCFTWVGTRPVPPVEHPMQTVGHLLEMMS